MTQQGTPLINENNTISNTTMKSFSTHRYREKSAFQYENHCQLYNDLKNTNNLKIQQPFNQVKDDYLKWANGKNRLRTSITPIEVYSTERSHNTAIQNLLNST
jgi:hypothetical protein